MAKYADTRSAGNSRVCPFRAGEESADRHWRRRDAAWVMRDAAFKWAEANAVDLTIANDKEHWMFRGRVYADWWPSSAKFVFNKKWTRGVHAHDVQQVIRLLDRSF